MICVFNVFWKLAGNQPVIGRLRKKRKWLTPAPTPVSTWKSREEEVLGWAGYWMSSHPGQLVVVWNF